MESRFAAYAAGEVDYVVETTDPEGAAYKEDVDEWRRDIERFSETTDFRGLEVLDSEQEGDEAMVHFRATLSRDGEDASFDERSQFRRVDGRWLYASGEHTD